MKKILMTMVAALGLAISANAQVYVGGGFAVQGHDNGSDTYTTYKFLPEVGYNLNDNWAVGTVFGWQGATKNGKKSFDINPYARFTPVHTKFINLFVDGGFGYEHRYGASRPSANTWSAGLRPGVAVNLNERLSFVSHVGFLGWSQSKVVGSNVKESQYGLDLDGNNISFSLYYNF